MKVRNDPLSVSVSFVPLITQRQFKQLVHLWLCITHILPHCSFIHHHGQKRRRVVRKVELPPYSHPIGLLPLLFLLYSRRSWRQRGLNKIKCARFSFDLCSILHKHTSHQLCINHGTRTKKERRFPPSVSPSLPFSSLIPYSPLEKYLICTCSCSSSCPCSWKVLTTINLRKRI